MTVEQIPTAEGFSTVIEKVGSFFTSKLKMIAGLLSSFSSDNKEIIKSGKLNGYQVQLETIKGKLKWVEKNVPNIAPIAQDTLPTIVGMRVSLYEVIGLLDKEIPTLINYIVGEVKTVSDIANKLLADESYRKTNMINFDNKNISARLASVESIIENIIDPKSRADRLPLEKIISNISGLKNGYDTLFKLGNNLSNETLGELVSAIEKIDDKIADIVNMIERNTFTVSKNMLEAFSSRVELVASLISGGMSLFFIYMQSVDMFIKIVEYIENKASK
jgi:hypothetical protein